MTPLAAGHRVPRHTDGSGPPVLLLHPLGADHQVWGPIVPHLGPVEHTSYDFPGHGEAPVPAGGYGIADLGRQLVGVLDAAGIGRAWLVGMSLGGLVAMQAAGSAPQRVAGLVVIDSVATYPAAMRQMWHERAATARRLGTAALVHAVASSWFTDDFAETASPDYLRAIETLRATDAEGYALACEALAGADVGAEVGRITCPSLVMCGRSDMPAMVEGAPWLTARIRDAELRWLPGRHLAALEQPDVAGRAIVDFVSGVRSVP